MWALDIVSQNEKLPHTLIPVIASKYCGKYAVPFIFWGCPVKFCFVLSFDTAGEWYREKLAQDGITIEMLKNPIRYEAL